MKVLKKIRGKGICLSIALFIQIMVLTLMPASAESETYAEEDRFYSMENKKETDKDGYIKLSLDKNTKKMTVDTYFVSCSQLFIDCCKDGKAPYIDLATENNVYPGYSFNVSLENLSDGHYLIKINYFLNNESKIRGNEYFHIVIEDGEPFFVKDFAYDLAKKQLDVLEKLRVNSMLEDTDYLGSYYSDMKAKADSIVAGCTTNYEKTDALYEWVMGHVRYTDNTKNEAVDVFKTGKGVCFGYANLLTALLRLEGIPAATITGGVYEKGEYFMSEPSDYYSCDEMGAHAWTVCYFDGKWRYLDPTWDDNDHFDTGTSRDWFDVSMESLAQNRTNLKLYHTFIIDDFLYTYDCGKLAVSSYIGKEDTIELPTEFLGEKIDSTGWYGFFAQNYTDKNNTEIKKVIIPESVEFNTLGTLAFNSYSKLEEIVVPDTIKYVEDGALLGCGEQLTVYCTPGSAMEKYAIEKNLKYVLYEDDFDMQYSSVTEGNNSYGEWVSDGQLSGTEGCNKKITKLKISTPNIDGVSIRAYIDGQWTNWVSNGEISSDGSDIQAIQVNVAGDLASKYDVYYRTHNRYFGWLGWTKNGAIAGTINEGSAIEGFAIKLVEKGKTIEGITNDTKESYRGTIVETKNVTTIYYKGYENPNIHYKIGNGKWTSVPGIKMEKSTVVSGYPYEIAIDLGEATSLTVCFNDGKGNWDSANGKNYSFGVGYYTYSNQKITKIEKPELKIDSVKSNAGDVIKVGSSSKMTINACGGEGPYTYTMYYKDGSDKVHYLLNKSDKNTGTFKADYAGKTTLFVEVTDGAGNTVRTEKVITVKEIANNQVTIYYKGYNNPYIHYKIGNGKWTGVPGVKMNASSAVSGYGYEITIDLGEATTLTACFNDGKGNWDSDNAKNYNFGVGYYTYSNKKITKIEKPSNDLKVNLVSSSAGDTIKAGSSSNITISVSGGEAPYTYTMYHQDGSGNMCYLLNKSNKNTAIFKQDYVGKTTLCIEVTDAAGTKVKAEKVIEVKETSKNQVTIYYKGYENPNIHYKIGNGHWTSVPGISMDASSTVSGYTYEITIDLGEATNLTACFNDGKGNWDSANGRNYYFEIGTYTYCNGKITKID